jgi:hypothetical protein
MLSPKSWKRSRRFPFNPLYGTVLAALLGKPLCALFCDVLLVLDLTLALALPIGVPTILLLVAHG